MHTGNIAHTHHHQDTHFNTSAGHKEILTIFFIQLVGYLLASVLLRHLSHNLSSSDVGTIYSAISLSTLTVVCLGLGINNLFILMVPAYLTLERADLIKGLVILSIKTMCCTVIIFLAGISIYTFFHQAPGMSFLDVLLSKPILLCISMCPLVLISQYLSSIAGSLHQNIIFSLCQSVLPYALLIALLWQLEPYTLTTAIIADTLAWSAPSLILLFTCMPFFKSVIRSSQAQYDYEKWSTNAAYCLINTLAFTAYASLGTVILKALSSNKANAAEFVVLMTICRFYGVASFSINLHFRTIFKHFSTLKNVEKLQENYNAMFLTSAILFITITVIIFMFPERILLLFGQRYLDLAPMLKALSVIIGINYIAHSCFSYLFYSDHQKEVIKIESTQLITSIILMVILVQYYGLIGAISAVILPRTILSFILLAYTRKTGIKSLVII